MKTVPIPSQSPMSVLLLLVVAAGVVISRFAPLFGDDAKPSKNSAKAQMLIEKLRDSKVSFSERARYVHDLAKLKPRNIDDVVFGTLRFIDEADKNMPKADFSRIYQTTVRAITTMGKSAIPGLLNGLMSDRVVVRKLSSICIFRISPRADSKEAFEGLKRAASDSEHYVSNHAIQAMPVFGARAVPTLDAALDNPNSQVSAAIALTKIGKPGQRAVPKLLKLLLSRNKNIRVRAATALGSIRPTSEKAAMEMARLMSETDPTTRKLLVEALGQMQSDAKGAASALGKLLDQEDVELRVSVLEALASIAVKDEETQRLVEKQLNDEHARVRFAAKSALKKLNPKRAVQLFGEFGSATKAALADIAQYRVGKHDWPQWGGSRFRNNVPDGKNIATTWDVETGRNIKWQTKLGSQSCGNPIVANGKVYVGTNNAATYLKRYPSSVDLGVLLCLDEKTGKFL